MSFFQILLLAFLLIPLLEIYLLIQVGGVIGAFPTVFMVVFTAVLGVWLIRIQGFSTLRRVQLTLAQGLVLAGALLLTPGFFTDAIGFLCLVPPIRRALIVGFLRHANIIQKSPVDRVNKTHAQQQETKSTRIIEGEYSREDDK